VMVERYIPGHDFRLLVVGNQVVAAARRDPPLVIGDGVHSVRELVEQVNSDPRRGEGHATSLTKIRFDDIALARLAEQTTAPTPCRARARGVILRNNANLTRAARHRCHRGCTSSDGCQRGCRRTDDWPGHLRRRRRCDSVLRPMESWARHRRGERRTGSAHASAAVVRQGARSREAIVSSMFAEGENGRIPVVAVADHGKTTTVRLIAHILEGNGLRTGMTNSDGVYIQGKRIDTGDCSGPKSARNVLLHPDVDAAVFETARGGVLREGWRSTAATSPW